MCSLQLAKGGEWGLRISRLQPTFWKSTVPPCLGEGLLADRNNVLQVSALGGGRTVQKTDCPIPHDLDVFSVFANVAHAGNLGRQAAGSSAGTKNKNAGGDRRQMRRPLGRLRLYRMLDPYVRQQIEEAIAELDRPAHESAVEARSFGPPGLRFETILEKSGRSLSELLEVVADLKAEKHIMHVEGWKHLTVFDSFRKRHDYYQG